MTSPWTDPGCYSVSDGVHRVPLQMPQDGLKAINVYVLETHDGLALIDGGWRRDTTHEEFATALSHIGRRPEEVHDIYVTHVHRDHYTFAVELRRRYGARVHLGRAEAPGISELNALGNSVPTSSLRELSRAGADDIASIAYRDALQDDFTPEDWEAPDSWLAEAHLSIPGHRIQAVHTPGHTKGHMVFQDLDRGICYTGDHVLPSITPSIGFELGEWDLPLAKYLASLTLMLDDADRLMMPSHGIPGGSVHARCLQLLAHHDRRLADVMGVVHRRGPSTGLDVAESLTWTRHDRSFESLDNFNQMIAACETLAHLDVLVDRGLISARTHDGVDIFA